MLLLSPSVVAIAVATRLLLIANLDPTVAMKIATTGGLVGTLVGTVVPLLPPFLPLFVVWLVIARRYFLAVMAAVSTILVSSAKVTWREGWQHILDQGPAFLPVQYTYPGLWVVALLSLIAAWAATPKPLRWPSIDALEKDIEEKVRKIDNEATKIDLLQEGFNHVTGRREFTSVDLPYMKATPQQRREWIALERDVLRLDEKDKRRRNVKWRVLYAMAVAAFSVPLVGVVAEFYVIPATGSDPAFILRRPWVPPEIVTTKAGRPIVGYVLSTADKWFTVLVEKDRTVSYIAADNVIGRSVCTLDPGVSASAGPLVRLRGVTGPNSKPCPHVS
ncbi:hypothetical protein [Amycolatopsis sp. NBC_01480]|uniref:hypothetical protein n=1 Tax=Amycolatopsis sp. NBC_01480 TaxID=2903562 RepID=UPI002E2D4D8D|nr:hypothetical protein [Amycolatopsis sp. NBC_01480]